MTKNEAVEWMVKEKLTENQFSAGHIWEGMKLWKYDTQEQKRMIAEYRLWRRASKDKASQCYQYVIDGKEPPKELITVEENENDQIPMRQ